MELSAYLTKKDGRVARDGAECIRIARTADTSPYYLYMLARGHKSPSLPLAQRISGATKGAVSVSDWPQRQAA